eukprot:GFUD01036546.1.p1 GENE.GFUD01036546.1~~GFUD01036546.1.p1  ORF type:complete len:566 (-),score=130.78 GFUD01036546.1:276-1925(-)
MADAESKKEDGSFLHQKSSVLGELAGRMKQPNPEGYKNRRDGDQFDESFPPPPPVFQTYAAQLSGKDEEEDLPPPPPPVQSGNYLSTLTPRPFITPSPYQSPLPPPPPPQTEKSQTSFCFSARPSSFSPSNSKNIRSYSILNSAQHGTPREQTEPVLNDEASLKHVSYKLFSPSSSNSTPLPPHKTKSPSSNTKPSTPWLSNNSAGVSPSFRSISSSSLTSDDSLPRRESNWSISPDHATRRVLGGFSDKQDKSNRDDLFDSAGMLTELNRIKRQCYSCSEEVQSGGCSAIGRTYHKDCFKCSNCKTVLEAKFFTEEDQPLCENCYKGEEKNCDVCSRPIEGDCLVSNGKNFHSKCMECSVCGDTLKGTYFTFMDKLICEKDYRETQKTCSDCKEVISGSYYTLDNDEVVCEKDYKKRLGNCERCGKVVEGKILRVSGGVYHPECFTCVACKESVVGVPFSLDDDKQIYCSEDYKRKHAAMCSVCSEPIVPKKGETSAARLRALGRDFHPECFKCEDCGLVLDSRITGAECYPVDNKPLCAKCSQNRQT